MHHPHKEKTKQFVLNWPMAPRSRPQFPNKTALNGSAADSEIYNYWKIDSQLILKNGNWSGSRHGGYSANQTEKLIILDHYITTRSNYIWLVLQIWYRVAWNDYEKLAVWGRNVRANIVMSTLLSARRLLATAWLSEPPFSPSILASVLHTLVHATLLGRRSQYVVLIAYKLFALLLPSMFIV